MLDLAGVHDDLRPLMFSLAYRMLGSVTDAEDVVQEAFLRLHRDATEVRNPEAYATTVTTRLALDQLRSARVRRERYVGSWLPEPLLTGGAAAEPATGGEADPAVLAERADSLSLAFLVVLETLSPLERAVFVLREAFGREYAEIAATIGRSEAACRQLFARAQKRIEERRPRYEASRDRRDELARRFVAAAAGGDLAALEELLAEDVVLVGDGGGRAPALRYPVVGRTRAARLMAGVGRALQRFGARMEAVEVNGQPGARVVTADGGLLSVFSVQVVDGHVAGVHHVLNQAKLAHLGPLADTTDVQGYR